MLEPGKHMLLYTCKSIWLASNFQYRYYMILLFNYINPWLLPSIIIISIIFLLSFIYNKILILISCNWV